MRRVIWRWAWKLCANTSYCTWKKLEIMKSPWACTGFFSISPYSSGLPTPGTCERMRIPQWAASSIYVSLYPSPIASVLNFKMFLANSIICIFWEGDILTKMADWAWASSYSTAASNCWLPNMRAKEMPLIAIYSITYLSPLLSIFAMALLRISVISFILLELMSTDLSSSAIFLINLSERATLTVVWYLSPVQIQTLMPELRSRHSVYGAFHCRASSRADTPRKVIFFSNKSCNVLLL